MQPKKRVRVKRLTGTPYYISEDQKLGKGSFGEVFRAYNKDSPNQPLVAKIINLHEQSCESAEAELQIMRELPRHENLVNCLRAHIQSANNLYIIMEYCNGGSLEDYINTMKLMPEEKIWDFLLQISKGYQVLLDASLIHRDIKPDNILINDGIFKIADFGLTKRLRNTSVVENLSFKGTPLYMAPEINGNQEGCSKVDVFSLGCVLYQLAYDGLHPFYAEGTSAKSVQDYFVKMGTAQLVLKQKNKKGQMRSLQLRELISKMLERNPQTRISWHQIFAHKKININKAPRQKINRPPNEKQQQLDFLRRSLIEVNRSSAKIQQFIEKDNAREQSDQMTLQLIEFDQLLGQREVKELERVVFRLKVTLLTILHCNQKISHLVRQNDKHKKFHSHIIDGLKRVTIQGLRYLLRNIDIVSSKIQGYDKIVVGQIRTILSGDRQKIIEECNSKAKLFKNAELGKIAENITSYDLRIYQHCLYSLLTEYCDYYKEIKQSLRGVVSLLVDIYDSSLKLTELTQAQKISWDKSSALQQAETKMDEICLNRVDPQQFHSYLMGKEHVSEKEVNDSLKRVGLLFQ